MIVQYNNKTYRVSGTTGDVEVRIKQGEPRVMQRSPRSAYWRSLKRSSETALQVRIRAFIKTPKEQTK
jgi:hypothetical protein